MDKNNTKKNNIHSSEEENTLKWDEVQKGFKDTFAPGTIAVGFNPERKTIINAILKNSSIVGKSIYNNIIRRVCE